MPKLIYEFTEQDKKHKKYWLAKFLFKQNADVLQQILHETHLVMVKRIHEEIGV